MGTVESAQGAEFYRLPDVAEAYGARPGYPPEAILLAVGSMAQHEHASNSPLRIFDAGCGTGQLTDALISGVAGAEIFAMDQSEAMVSALPDHIKESVVPVVGSFDKMPFADGCFDLVTFGTSLHWGDPDRVPSELYRVLRPGGVVASISNVTRAGTEFSAILDELPGHAAKMNPMTADPERLDLGEGFAFLGFKKFANDLRLAPSDFNRLLASIELFKAVPPELAEGAWLKMQEYADNNVIDGRIVVPFDTFVRVSKVGRLTTAGVMACQKTVGL